MVWKYILNDRGEPVPEPDLLRWASWFETADRQVGDTHAEGVRISTVFLGTDMGWGHGAPPVLWETMVFGGPLDQEQTRCAGTREQAEAMHLHMVERVGIELKKT